MYILFEVSNLSSYQAALREVHLEQIYHIFSFLKNRTNLTPYFDPQKTNIEPSWFNGDSVNAFKDQYQDFEEQFLPSHMCPESRGVTVSTTSYVDASYSDNKITHRSHTGFIIFLNQPPIISCSKRQNTVEASNFWSEFIATKACI